MYTGHAAVLLNAVATLTSHCCRTIFRSCAALRLPQSFALGGRWRSEMKLVIAYLVLVLVVVCWLWSIDLRGALPPWLVAASLPYRCSLMGAIGGLIYCLRAVYLNRSVRAQWDSDWHVWYFLRPIVSTVIGAVSYVLLSAGLLVLGASPESGSLPHGYLALAFIAGLNVDRFLARIEDIAQSTWGIRPSRAGSRGEE